MSHSTLTSLSPCKLIPQPFLTEATMLLSPSKSNLDKNRRRSKNWCHRHHKWHFRTLRIHSNAFRSKNAPATFQYLMNLCYRAYKAYIFTSVSMIESSISMTTLVQSPVTARQVRVLTTRGDVNSATLY